MSTKKSNNAKEHVGKLLVDALGLEFNAITQYQSFALSAKAGDYRSEKVGELFAELATDEIGDLKKFTEWVVNVGEAVKANLPIEVMMTDNATKMLECGIKMEKDGVRLYREILDAIKANQAALDFDAEGLYHTVMHIIIDEEEHIRKMTRLL